ALLGRRGPRWEGQEPPQTLRVLGRQRVDSARAVMGGSVLLPASTLVGRERVDGLIDTQVGGVGQHVRIVTHIVVSGTHREKRLLEGVPAPGYPRHTRVAWAGRGTTGYGCVCT